MRKLIYGLMIVFAVLMVATAGCQKKAVVAPTEEPTVPAAAESAEKAE